MTPTPKPTLCPMKQALTDLFQAAVWEIIELQEAELEALQEGASLERFDVALVAAQSKKDQIKQEYLFHVQMHGC